MFQRQFQRLFPLVRASADDVPFDDESFDFAISEYGASTWLDPYWWVPEAARLLRPGGRLVFFVSGALMMCCTPADGSQATRVLERDYFGMHRFEFSGQSFVEFHLSHGDWLRVLRANGFELEELIEVQPSEGAVDAVPVCLRRVGASLAERGDLDRPPTRLSRRPVRVEPRTLRRSRRQHRDERARDLHARQRPKRHRRVHCHSDRSTTRRFHGIRTATSSRRGRHGPGPVRTGTRSWTANSWSIQDTPDGGHL